MFDKEDYQALLDSCPLFLDMVQTQKLEVMPG